MTLKDIIDDLSVRLQHTLSKDDIVRYVNYALYDIKRVAAKLDVFGFDAQEKVSLYPLPTYVAPEGIKTVTVDGTEHLPKRLNEVQKDCTYHITPDGYINLYPAPKVGQKVYIAYEGVSPLLTLSEVEELHTDLAEEDVQAFYENQDTGIDDEYAILIPLWVAISAAEAMEDINLANNFRVQYNNAYKKAQQGKYLKRGKYPVTRVVQ
jgi:hypothetical protein